MNSISNTKKCTKCGEIKDIDEFYPVYPQREKRSSECKTCFKKRCKAYHLLHSDKSVKAARRWQMKNRDKVLLSKKRHNQRKRGNPGGKLNHNIASAICRSLSKGTKNNRHWESLVDFTIEQLKRHLEKKFSPGMSWDNYGTVWQIDHKIPVAVFNFEKPEDIDFRICWSLKNLQPLEAKMNSSKQAKIDKPFQPSLAISVYGRGFV
jgi:hypothetical protein